MACALRSRMVSRAIDCEVMSQPAALPVVRYTVATPSHGWELGVTMPESLLHDEIVSLLKALLSAWAARVPGSHCIARNIAVRWDETRPAIGVDPDVCVLSPAPSDPRLRSVRTWRDGLAAPVLAIEVVSETNQRKDYSIAPDKYAASGTGELVIFDPLLSGPPSQGGPVRLQVWRRDDAGDFTRVYAGPGPAYSHALSAL